MNAKVHGMAMCVFGSLTKNSDHFHSLAQYLHPVLSTPYNSLPYPRARWIMLRGERSNGNLLQKAKRDQHYWLWD